LADFGGISALWRFDSVEFNAWQVENRRTQCLRNNLRHKRN
jgi:hypothetical protein